MKIGKNLGRQAAFLLCLIAGLNPNGYWLVTLEYGDSMLHPLEVPFTALLEAWGTVAMNNI